MPPQTTQPARGDGCGFLLGTIVFSCLLLILNGVIITGLYQFYLWWSPDGPSGTLQRIKAPQIFVFVGPVLLLFAEWTLIDMWGRRRSARKQRKAGK